jgi:hypothetical protein
MLLQNINSENDLRSWLHDVAPLMKYIQLQWIEPSLYGSTVGAGDLIMKMGDNKVDVELKYLFRTTKGTKFTLRPAQRRFHHSSMRRGGKTCLLYVLATLTRQMFLVRGDRLPLRDYASNVDSGCENGKLDSWPVCGSTNEDLAYHLVHILFGQDFWV